MERKNRCGESAEKAIGVNVHVWEPRVLGISTKRRVSACSPRRVE